MAFECGVCALIFNNSGRVPIILECGHTFCKDCLRRKLGTQRHCPYCRNPIRKDVEQLPRNYALENAMEAANLPLVELLDRWGFANAERLMVKPDQLQLTSLISRKGNTGEVWKGTLWGKQVAVKLIRIGDLDGRHLECLRREVAVLLHTTGECKQVCIYKGFCMKGAHFAIIMKLYSCSLAARIARHPGRRLPLYLALKYAIDIAKGLVELHKLGVMVADLKPDNVLLDEELGDAVIADFGISSVVTGTLALKRSSGVGPAAHHSSSGGLRGTPHYMAPEQFGPRKLHTIKADLWGFACTLLHMLTGVPPWAHDNMLQICTTVGVRRQPPTVPEGLPQELERLLGCCLTADPAKRPAAQQVLKVLIQLAPRVDPAAFTFRSASAQRQRLLAAARGLLSGLKEDVGHLANELAERAAAAAAAAAGGQQDPARLGSIPEDGMPSGDDKVYACDQHLQQLEQLLGESSASSSSGPPVPSAPPLPAGLLPMRPTHLSIPPTGQLEFDQVNSPATSCDSGSPDRRGCSSIASSSSAYRPILWTDQQGLEEEMQYQQQQYGKGRSGGHGRSNSAVPNYSQQQLAGDVMRAAGDGQLHPHSPVSPGRHQRSVSELPPGSTLAAAVLKQRRRWEGVGSHPLATHHEAEADGCSSPGSAAVACEESGHRYRRTSSSSSTTGVQLQHQESGPWTLPGSSEVDPEVRTIDSSSSRQPPQQELLRAADSPVSQLGGRCSSKQGRPMVVAAGQLTSCHQGWVSGQSNVDFCGRKAGPEDSAAAWGLNRCESSMKGGSDADSRPYTASTCSRYSSPSRRPQQQQQAGMGPPGTCTGTTEAVAAGGWCSKFELARPPGTASSSSSLMAGTRPGQLLQPGSPGPLLRLAAGSPSTRLPSGMATPVGVVGGSNSVPPDSPSKVRRTLGDLLLGRDRSNAGTPVNRSSSAATASPARSLSRGQPSILSTCGTGAPSQLAVPAVSTEAAAVNTPKLNSPMNKLRRLFGMPPLQLPPEQMIAPPSTQRTAAPSEAARPAAHSSSSATTCSGQAASRHLPGSFQAGDPDEVTSVQQLLQPPCSPSRNFQQQHTPSECGSPHHRRMASAPPAIAAPAIATLSPLRRHKHQLSLPGGTSPLDIREPVSPGFAVSPPPAQYSGAESPGAGGSAVGAAFCAGAAAVEPAAARLATGAVQQQPGPSSSAAAPPAPSAAADFAGRPRQSLLAEAAACEEAAKQLMALNQLPTAEARIRRAVELLIAALGPSHPSVYSAQSRLASCLSRLGEYSEAEALFRRVLQQRGALLGRTHPQAATAANNLATCLYAQGKYGAAAKLYGSALAARQKALGLEHPDTTACLNNLALCHMRQGNYVEAAPLCEEALQLRSAALGPVHQEVATAAYNLGVCQSQLGQYEAALQAHQQALAVRQQLPQEETGQQSSGSSSGSTLLIASHRAVAACLARLGRHEEAGEHLSCVLEAARSTVADVLLHGVPPLSQQRIHSVVNSAGKGGSSSQTAAQADSYEDGADLTEQQQQCLLAVATAAEELGRCYSHQQQHVQAEELYWEAMESAAAVMGSRAETVQRLEGALRECLGSQLQRGGA